MAGQSKKTKHVKQEELEWLKSLGSKVGISTWNFCKQNWIGTLIILAATLLFFAPIVTRIDSYSEGGDAMFNAWTLARNHHCIIGQGCPDYVDGNIYFPHKDTMLYSETQLSAGLLTLPFFFINSNPIFAYNMWTVLSVFFGAWFMYLLAKYLSKGNEWISILAGLIFAFAPFKMAAVFHLQNLSIFYLPLAALLTFKFFDTKKKSYLGWLLLVLVLLFYASWYNLVFAAAGLAVLVLGYLIFKLINIKQALSVFGIMAVAALSTLPLALQFMRFSREAGATFSIKDQLLYQSSLIDYFLPHNGTILGKIFYSIFPGERQNAFNLDSFSYHGIILYFIAALLLVVVFMNRKKGIEAFKNFGKVATLIGVAIVGFILSLGPLLKIKGSYAYGSGVEGVGLALPLPYLLIDKFLPQLTFIRAVGRWSVLVLFALCCLLAFAVYYASSKQWFKKYKIAILLVITIVVAVELMPTKMVTMSKNDYSYNLEVPEVYRFINQHPEINNIVVLRGDEDYPGAPIPIARAEDVLWAGYHNRNIYNGYSGYTPPEYFIQYARFKDFGPDAVPEMKSIGLKYVIVDKMLSTNRPNLASSVDKVIGNKLYEDERYSLHKL